MPYDQGETDFNEMAYGMYVTFEVQAWLRLQGDLDGVAMPPTLREEADLGYDMAIPRRWGLLFLQFKIPRYLRRSNASEYHTFGEPYFRFPVKTDVTSNGNVQHNVLCNLERHGNDVFYAAPAFLTSRELSDFALNDGMYVNSVFPRPTDLGDVDAGSQHCFAYTDSANVRAFSEPGPKLPRPFSVLESAMRTSVAEAEERPLREFMASSLNSLSELVDLPGSTSLEPTQRFALAASSVGLQPILVHAAEEG